MWSSQWKSTTWHTSSKMILLYPQRYIYCWLQWYFYLGLTVPKLACLSAISMLVYCDVSSTQKFLNVYNSGLLWESATIYVHLVWSQVTKRKYNAFLCCDHSSIVCAMKYDHRMIKLWTHMMWFNVYSQVIDFHGEGHKCSHFKL